MNKPRLADVGVALVAAVVAFVGLAAAFRIATAAGLHFRRSTSEVVAVLTFCGVLCAVFLWRLLFTRARDI